MIMIYIFEQKLYNIRHWRKFIKKIYIAGFDVFAPNAKEIGEKYKEICEANDFIGLYPLDGVANGSHNIFLADISLIDECNIIVANLNSFRGDVMDDGTAFELGYGFAKKKTLYGYMDDTRDMIEKLGNIDNQGYLVENFNNPINLMIAESTTIMQGDFENCIKNLRKLYNNNFQRIKK